MANADRAHLYNELKEAGYKFSKHFREYSVNELQDIKAQIAAQQAARTGVAVKDRDVTELPSQRRGQEEEPIRTDLDGKVWYQEEIIKAGTARPRGYRIYREIGTDVKQVTVEDGDGYTETIEVAGDRQKPVEVKVGIPTWQVGIYKDPRLPFKIMVYRNARGYVREDVELFFGGPDVVPENVAKTYVGNMIGYDIRSTNTAIQREHNQLVRKGQVV